MKHILSALVLSVPLLASAQNLIVNGSFETTLSGSWNLSGLGAPNRITYGSATPATFGEAIPVDTVLSGSSDSAGSWALYFVDDLAAQAVSQTFNLTAGITYDVGFEYYATINGSANVNNSTLSTFVTAVSNSQASAASVVSLAAAPVGSWTPIRSTITPSSSGAYTFSFVFSSLGAPAKDVVVDRAFISAVPEPETYGLMLAGMLTVAAVARRRQSKA